MQTTWMRQEKHGRFAAQNDSSNIIYVFSNHRKDALRGMQRLRDAGSHFNRSIDADRALVLANIEQAARFSDVDLTETSWHNLAISPVKNRKMAAANATVTRNLAFWAALIRAVGTQLFRICHSNLNVGEGRESTRLLRAGQQGRRGPPQA